MFGLVSKKKYNQLKSAYGVTKLQLDKAEGALDDARCALHEEKRVNQELKASFDIFKEFYNKIVAPPILVQVKDRKAIVATQIKVLDARDIGYGDELIDHLKTDLVHQLADYMYQQGLINFDLTTDPITDKTALKACIEVLGVSSYDIKNH